MQSFFVQIVVQSNTSDKAKLRISEFSAKNNFCPIVIGADGSPVCMTMLTD